MNYINVLVISIINPSTVINENIYSHLKVSWLKMTEDPSPTFSSLYFTVMWDIDNSCSSAVQYMPVALVGKLYSR